MFNRYKWRSLFIAALACLTIPVFSAQAFANPPGESSSYSAEMAGGSQIQSSGPISQARNSNGDWIDVWRGQNSTNLWVSFRNGPAYQISSSTATNVAPRVIAYGEGFAIFHTGTNGQIYWTGSTVSNPTSGSWWQSWFPVPGQTTWDPVSVTQVGASDSTSIYLTYRSSSGDNYIYGSYFNGSSWNTPGVIAGGQSNSGPSVVWDSTSNTLFTWIRGLDNNQIYEARQPYGQQWVGWFSVGGATVDVPAVAAAADGNMVGAVRDQNNHVWFDTFSPGGIPTQSNWTQDTSNWQTNGTPPTLSVNNNNNTVYTQFNGGSNADWYGQAYHQ